MADSPRWHLYPIGVPATTASAVGFTLVSLPLMATLLIPVFILVRYLAGKGLFGVGASGAAWGQWAQTGIWAAVLLLALGGFATALVNLAATALTARRLLQAPRRGGGPQKVPHPDQWMVVAGWTGMGLVLGGIVVTAVLALPRVFPTALGGLLQGVTLLHWPRVVGFAVIGIALAGLYRKRHDHAMRVLQRAWPAAVREAVEEAGKQYLDGRLRLDADPDAGGEIDDLTARVLMAHGQRRLVTVVGWRMHVIGLALLGLAVLAAVILLPIGVALAGSGPAAGYQMLFLSPLVLVVSGGVLLTAGAVLAAVDESALLRRLLARARTGAEAEAGTLARVGTGSSVPGVNLLGMIGAVAVVLALPALIDGSDSAGALGVVGVLVGVGLMLIAVVFEVVVRLRIRPELNRVFQRWPMPGATVQAQRVPEFIARRIRNRA